MAVKQNSFNSSAPAWWATLFRALIYLKLWKEKTDLGSFCKAKKKNTAIWSQIFVLSESIPAFKVIFFPTNLSPTGIIAQEDKPLLWICLHHRGHKILIAYFTLFAQLINQGRTWCQQVYGYSNFNYRLPWKYRNNYPAGKLWNLLRWTEFVIIKIIQPSPIPQAGAFYCCLI